MIGCRENNSEAVGVLSINRIEISEEPVEVLLDGLNGLHCIGFIDQNAEQKLDGGSIEILSAPGETSKLVKRDYAGTCGDGVPGYRHLATINCVGSAKVLIAITADHDQGEKRVEVVVMKSPQQRVL